MCQSCVDDGYLSQSTFDAIEEFLSEYPDAEFGPGHIVLADDNVSDSHITWCLGLAKAEYYQDAKYYTKNEDTRYIGFYSDENRDTLKATIDFLESLLVIPESER